MKSKIIAISIQRNLRANKYGMDRETVVFFTRANDNESSRYTTNDILQRGNISDASVIRAKRAQAALMNKDNHNE